MACFMVHFENRSDVLVSVCVEGWRSVRVRTPQRPGDRWWRAGSQVSNVADVIRG